MYKEIVISFLDGDKVILNKDSFATLIKNSSEIEGDNRGFYSSIIYQNYLLNETNPPIPATTSSPMVGLMGALASSDFFTISNNNDSCDIDSADIIIYKTSAIKSISFN